MEKSKNTTFTRMGMEDGLSTSVAQQITIWLTKVDLGWLNSERERLTNKGWKMVVKEDDYGRISLWRTG